MPDPQAIDAERAQAVLQLEDWADRPLMLKRRVYFVPGLSDEEGTVCWGTEEEPKLCLRNTLPEVCANPGRARFHSFLVPGNPRRAPEYENFIRFGADLARRIHADVLGTGEKVDLVCHSMGGLDAFTAIALLDDYRAEFDVEPLRCVQNLVAYDTPFAGFRAADNAVFLRIKRLSRPDEPWIISQATALKPDSLRIQEVAEARDRFLRNVAAFHPRGADNFDGLLEVPHESASFGRRQDFSPEWRDRYRPYRAWEDTSHSGRKSVTRDPRVIVELLKILTG